ncbi:DnaJ domain-containing protein [Spirosoma luteum]|uniref:DnaJ domain-containing protein n=1 Tax=Spirosoma luteum TaxID=431553 RepID=UPI00037C9D7A|nr:DnaJ domain-containing protein [Spirosoma luteum]
MRDFYYILGIEANAPEQEIKTAHRKLSLKFHPDKNSGDDYFEKRFRQIQEAYETLSNPSKRIIYDSQLSSYKAGNGNSESLKRYEEALKRKYEEELRKKEEEIKQRYQTPAQRAFEELEKKRKENEAKKQADQKRIAEELQVLKSNLAQKESSVATLQREIVVLKNRISELKMRFDSSATDEQNTDAKYEENPISYPHILAELNRIKSKVPIQSRISFVKTFLRFVKEHSIEASFEKKHPDLVKLIVQGVVKSDPFEGFYRMFQRNPLVIDKFEAQVFAYVTSTSN